VEHQLQLAVVGMEEVMQVELLVFVELEAEPLIFALEEQL
jgi:hypothetical protein